MNPSFLSRNTMLSLGVLVAMIRFATSPAAAQVALDPLLVTAMSSSTAAHWEDGTALEQSEALSDTPFTVSGDQEVMLFSRSGQVVLQIMGPAKLAVRNLDEEDRIDVKLFFGVLITVTPTPRNIQVVEIVSSGEGAKSLFRGRVGRGRTVYSCYAGRQIADIVYVGEAGATLGLQLDVLGQPQKLAVGDRIAIDGDRIQRAASAAWLEENSIDFADHMNGLGLKSALIARRKVVEALVDDILNFDRFADVGLAIKTLESDSRFQAELRQVSTATPVVEASQNQAGAPDAGTIQGANEVPNVSPASISVGGITALQLNQNAANLARRTNSRALGFNGLRLLAIPGTVGGVPTAGPPGVAGVQP